MSWSTAPTPPPRKYGPSWNTGAAPPPTVHKGGWFALLERVIPFDGSGTLAAAVTPHIATQTDLDGGGALSIKLAIRNYRTALLTGIGLPTVTAFETRSRTATFTGNGEYAAASINDGLSAIVGYGAPFSGGGALHADIVGGHEVVDGLSATATAIIDGLSATATAI